MVKYQRTQSKKNQELALKRYGLERTWIVRNKAWIFVGFISFVAVATGLIFQFLGNADGANVAMMIITLGAFILAYQQWDEAKNETSIDKYYERLDLTNSRLNDWHAARAMFPNFWRGEDRESFEKAMYVYLELDNLEYAIEKYRLGYMSAAVAYRSLETFKSRAESREFRELALEYVVKSSGYQDITEKVVSNICSIVWDKTSIYSPAGATQEA